MIDSRGSDGLPGNFEVHPYGYGKAGLTFLPLLPGAGIKGAAIRDRKGNRLYRPWTNVHRVFVDATSWQYDGPGAGGWVRRLEEALRRRGPIATCGKATLAIGWARLVRTAKTGKTTIWGSANVGGGTPVLHFLRQLERCHGIARTEAVLRAIPDHIVSLVVGGTPISEPVRRAQLAGSAEPDPRFEVEGTDLYAKAVIIHSSAYERDHPLVSDDSRSRLQVGERQDRSLARPSGRPQAIAAISPRRGKLSIGDVHTGDDAAQGAETVAIGGSPSNGLESFLSCPGAGPLLGDLLALTDLDRVRTVLP
jgi:hypothetical protein